MFRVCDDAHSHQSGDMDLPHNRFYMKKYAMTNLWAFGIRGQKLKLNCVHLDDNAAHCGHI